jgi:hypothetical protein
MTGNAQMMLVKLQRSDAQAWHDTLIATQLALGGMLLEHGKACKDAECVVLRNLHVQRDIVVRLVNALENPLSVN